MRARRVSLCLLNPHTTLVHTVGWYVPGQAKATQPLNATALYKEDRLGLQQLDKEGKLVFLGCEGNHLQFTDEYCTLQD